MKNSFAIQVIFGAILLTDGLCGAIEDDTSSQPRVNSREKRHLYFPYNSAVAVWHWLCYCFDFDHFSVCMSFASQHLRSISVCRRSGHSAVVEESKCVHVVQFRNELLFVILWSTWSRSSAVTICHGKYLLSLIELMIVDCSMFFELNLRFICLSSKPNGMWCTELDRWARCECWNELCE